VVVDASVAVKWVVEEEGSEAALRLRGRAQLAAPDLILAECANILWKRQLHGELHRDEAVVAARLLGAAGLELTGGEALLAAATEMACELGHPAYDCFYVALAERLDTVCVSADRRLVRALGRPGRWRGRVVALA
jgi:predicted nucleic acid-binding protein